MTDTHVAREGAFNAAVLAATLIGEHAADTVEILNKLPPSDAADVVRLLPRDFAIEILDKPELDFGAEIIEALPRHVAAPLLAGMSADMAADIVQQLESQQKRSCWPGWMMCPAVRSSGCLPIRRTPPAR